MKTVTIKPFGVEVSYEIPSTLAEMIEKAGGGSAGEEIVRELAHRQFLYHSALGTIRSKVADAAEKQGAKRKIFDGKKGEIFAETTTDAEGEETTVYTNAKGKEVKDPSIKLETEDQFIKRICAEEGVEVGEKYLDLIQSTAAEVPYDLTVKERTVADKKLAKVHLEAAQEVVDAGAQDQVVAKLSELLGKTIDLSVAEDSEGVVRIIAAAISENEARERAAVKSKYLNMA